MHNQARAIWWVKRDMRLADNEALTQAIKNHAQVNALFICEPSVYNAADTSPMHVFAWWQALSGLQQSLRAIGGELYFAKGEATAVLDHVHSKTPFDALYSHEETGNGLTFERDKAVQQWCTASGATWTEHTQSGVVRAIDDRNLRNDIIEQRLFLTSPIATPSQMQAWPIEADHIISTQWPDYTALCDEPVNKDIQFRQMQQVNERCAQQELQHFLHERVSGYQRGISSPNSAIQTGSRLSVHLAWGTISARTVFFESNQRIAHWQASRAPDAKHWIRNIQAFQSRLHWRDHFVQRLESASFMEHRALNPAFEQMVYQDDPELLQAWLKGNTGMPLVDACMRCLQATGFLNFRMRAMLVTTACFGLRLSWQTVQHPLAKVFYDYEPGIHFSQMQMQAGIVGINTMRVYNPYKQLLDQDPNCVFIKHWIPELAEFSAADITDYNNTALGDYPSPIDDIAANSRDIKNQISRIKKSDEASEPTATVLGKHGSRLRSRRKKTKKSPPQVSPQLKLPF